MLFLKKRQKNVLKQNSQVGGSIFQVLHSVTNRMIPTPHRYLFCVWRNYQNNFKNVSENRKISCYFWKNVKKNVLKQNSQVGGSIFQVLHSVTNRMIPTPYLYLFCVWRNYQNNFKNVSEKRKISCYFWKNVKKNVLKQNSQVGGFYFPRTAFNYKSNGINLSSVSFLCVEKLPK